MDHEDADSGNCPVYRLQCAHTAYVLETGDITMSGTGSELLADDRIKEAYLGKSKN